MTNVYYFGKESSCPKCIIEKEQDKLQLKKIDFNATSDNPLEDSLFSFVKPNYLQSVSCGNSFTCLLDDKNELWTFGAGICGQLGSGRLVHKQNYPLNISRISKKKFLKVSGGDTHTFGLGTDHKLYCWGETAYGKVIFSETKIIQEPKEVPNQKFCNFIKINPTEKTAKLALLKSSELMKSLKMDETTQKIINSLEIQDVVCGSQHTFVIIKNQIMVFGKETTGQLGLSDISAEESAKIPQPLTYFKNVKIVGVAAASRHTLAWDNEGTVYSWGEPNDGKLGYPVDTSSQKTSTSFPKKITLLNDILDEEKIIMGSCGDNYSCALTNNGDVYGWGRAISYKVKSQNPSERVNLLIDAMRPKKLKFEEYNGKKIKIIKICCGNTQTAALDQLGVLFTWGENSNFCLGLNTLEDIPNPTRCILIDSKNVIDVGCGDKFMVIITADSNLKGINLNLKNFHSQSKLLLDTKLHNLVEFSHKKAIFINNLENMRKETLGDIPPINKMKSLNLSLKKETSTYNNLNILEPHLKDPKTKKQLIEKSYNLLMDLEDTQRETKEKELKGYEKEIQAHEIHQNDPRKEFSRTATKKFNISMESLDHLAIKERDETIDDNAKFLQNSLGKDLIDLIKRQNKNIKFEEPEEIDGNMPHTAHIIYDSVASQMISKEHNDPIFYPLDIIKNEALIKNVNNKEDEQKMIYQGKKIIIDELKKTMVKPRSDKVIRQQNLLLNTEKEVLKYEYFQKIKFGLEEEHLVYLMSNSKQAETKTPDDEKNKKKHERKIREFELYNEKVKGKIKKTQDLLTQNKLDEVYEDICSIYKKTDRLLFNYADSYRKMKIQKEKEKDDPKFEFLKSPEKYHQKIQNDLKKSSQKRNWRLRKANKLKREMVLRRKKEIEDDIQKKSIVYRQNQTQKDVKKKEIYQKLRKLMATFNLELLLKLINQIASESLNFKKSIFKFNMKARIIQMALRKHIVTKKVYSLNAEPKKALETFGKIFKLKLRIKHKREAVDKIYSYFLINLLRKKVISKLLFIRKSCVSIQIFMLWFDKMNSWEMGQLISYFDKSLVQAFKSDFNKIKKTAKISTLPVQSQKSIVKRKSSILSPLIKVSAEEQKPLSFKEFLVATQLNKTHSLFETRYLPDNYYEEIAQRFIQKAFEDQDSKESQSQMPNLKEIEEQIIQGLKAQNFLKASRIYRDNIFHSFLPYSIHKDKGIIPALYRLKYEASSLHEKINYRMIIEELAIKYEKLHAYRNIQRTKYIALLNDYFHQLTNFVHDKKEDINLERAKMMLRTNVEELKKIQRREQHLFIKSMSITKDYNKVDIVNELSKMDYLPFANKISVIAAKMPNHPKKPKFNLKITNSDTFKHIFNQYYEAIKMKYMKLANEARIKIANAYKIAKPVAKIEEEKKGETEQHRESSLIQLELEKTEMKIL